MKRLGLFLFLLLNVSCEDLGTNPWEGWENHNLWGVSFSLPSGAVVPWVDPNPPAYLRHWRIGDSISVTFVYAPGQDTMFAKALSCYPGAMVENIVVGSHPGKLLTCAFTPLTSLDWRGVLRVFLPHVGNGQNQVSFEVLYTREKATPELIVRSLRINGDGMP
jgi:hypothetical protein